MLILLLLLSTVFIQASDASSSSEDEVSFLSLSPSNQKHVKPVTTINYSRVAIIAPTVCLENISPDEDLIVVRDPRQGYVILNGIETEPIDFVSESFKKMSPYEFSIHAAYHTVFLSRDADGKYHLSENQD